MDILTERGQVFQGHAMRAVQLFEARYGSSYGVTLTDWRKPISYDGLIFHRETKKPVAVLEIKTRQETYQKFATTYKNTWLLTHRKLVETASIAKQLGVPLYGFLYLIPNDTLLTLRLAEKDGSLCNLVDAKNTVTQATCNGGLTERLNAFVDISKAQVIEGEWGNTKNGSRLRG